MTGPQRVDGDRDVVGGEAERLVRDEGDDPRVVIVKVHHHHLILQHGIAPS